MVVHILFLSDECTFHYKLAFDGNYNDVDKQFVIKWNDPNGNLNGLTIIQLYTEEIDEETIN